MRRLDPLGNTINIIQHVDLSLEICDFFQYQQVAPFCLSPRFQRQKQLDPSSGKPSNLNPASKEIISDSVELCETDVCFMHIQLIGTNV